MVDYLSQVYELRDLIQERREWQVVKKIEDKIESPEETGYRSLHIVALLNTTNFQGVLAEIQIRTMLEDAWATKTHSLTYKKKAEDIPKPLLKLIRRLSDRLHTADHIFEDVKNKIEQRG